MKTTVLARTGDTFKVMFKNDEGYYLLTVGISGTLSRVWGLKTDQQKLDATVRLAEIIGSQSSLKPDSDEENYLFTTHNSEATLEQTLARPDLPAFSSPQ